MNLHYRNLTSRLRDLMVVGVLLHIALRAAENLWAHCDNRGFFLLADLALVLLMLLLAVWHIWKPLRRLEDTIHMIEGTQGWNHAPMQDRASNATDDLNRLIEHYKSVLKQEYTMKALKDQAELNALQSQINPHFLYNTLESIRGQALMSDMDEIAEMTEALSTFFRYNISQKGNFVSLRDEIINTENYFKIQCYRFDQRFSLRILYDDQDEDMLSYQLPKLTLQPVVENCIYHGLEPKIGQGHISIRVMTTNQRLIIRISDDGMGMEREVLNRLNQRLNRSGDEDLQEGSAKRGGIALINVNKRIKMHFGEAYGMRISSTPRMGTDFEIILPRIQESDGMMPDSLELRQEGRNTHEI